MFTLNIAPQPFELTFDMSQVESYDEKTKELKLFNTEVKTVKEDINGVEFTTEKEFSRKYLFDCSNVAVDLEPKLVDMINGVLDVVTIAGNVTYSSEATLKATVEYISQIVSPTETTAV